MQRPVSRVFLDQSALNFGSMPKIKFSDHLVKNLGNGWSK